MNDGEVRLTSEVRLHELGMGGVAAHQLFDETLVGGFGEPALFVHEGHDTHRLQSKQSLGSAKSHYFNSQLLFAVNRLHRNQLRVSISGNK